MDYETFKEKFVEDLQDRLYEQGAEVNISVHTVNKLNESYEAVTVTPEGSNIGVNVGIDKFYDAMENGRSYDEVVDKAVDVVTNGITQRPDFDINSLSDYSQMKEKLAMEVVSAEANKEMLETVPHEAERKGLGTPATRAGIIEKLVRIGFIERKGDKKTKYLVPTHKGEALITVIPEAIQSASMTAEWEQKLLEVERESYSSDQFMGEIESLVRELVDTYEIVQDAEVLMKPVYAPLGKCPACGSDVIEKSKGSAIPRSRITTSWQSGLLRRLSYRRKY